MLLFLLAQVGALERLGNSAWFAVFALGSLSLLVLSFLFGHDHDADHDHDVSHDGGADHGEHNMSPLSIKVILMFATGFGCGGYVGARMSFEMPLCILSGFIGGLLLGGLGYAVLNSLFKRQANSVVHVASLVGTSGIVDIPIGKGEVGRIICTLEGVGHETFTARSTDGKAIPSQTQIKIVAVSGSTVTVERL